MIWLLCSLPKLTAAKASLKNVKNEHPNRPRLRDHRREHLREPLLQSLPRNGRLQKKEYPPRNGRLQRDGNRLAK